MSRNGCDIGRSTVFFGGGGVYDVCVLLDDVLCHNVCGSVMNLCVSVCMSMCALREFVCA